MIEERFMGHGTLHSIYASIAQTCTLNGWHDGPQLLIIGGDFQAIRNSSDLPTMSVPPKYRAIGDFHEYYSGARRAPYLTLFVGGNHEASSHLRELYYGGWVAPNIYYLGNAAVVRFGELRIAGMSGIWNGPDYRKALGERLPYGSREVRSVYHTREWDVRRLCQVRRQVDVGVSHDWPRGVEWEGDWRGLFRKKDLFEKDAREGRLGSVAASTVMERLRPRWWFSAHMHCKFSAVVRFDEGEWGKVKDGKWHAGRNGMSNGNVSGKGKVNPNEIPINGGKGEEAGTKDPPMDGADEEEATISAAPVKNEDEIDLDMDDDEEANAITAISAPQYQIQSLAPSSGPVPENIRAQLPASFAKPETRHPPQSLPPPLDIKNNTTHFLALDKPGPNRQFLQLLDLGPINKSPKSDQTPPRLSYDKEWLAITRVFAQEGDPTLNVPRDKGQACYLPLIEREEKWVEQNLVQTGKMSIPENFELTAPLYDPSVGLYPPEQSKECTNPQTVAFCEMLQIPNHFDTSEEDREERRLNAPKETQDQGGRGGRGGGWRGRGDRGGGGGGRGRGRGRGRGYR